MNQVQNALQYWTNGLISSEEADKLKADKEKEILANVVVERDSKEDDDSANVPVPTVCMPQSNPHLYD